jgi:hypothetical protein
VKDLGWRPDQDPWLHVPRLLADGDRRPAGEDIVELVGPLVGVRRLFLPRLETVEAEEDLVAFEEIGLGCLRRMKVRRSLRPGEVLGHAVSPGEMLALLSAALTYLLAFGRYSGNPSTMTP